MERIAKNEPLIIGLDLGTTAVKVLAANPYGDTIAVAEASYHLSQPQEGYREQDPDEILQTTENTLKKVLDQLDQPVSAISFGAAMHSLIAVDKEGKPLTPAMIWADVRSTSYAATLRESELGRQIYKASGAPIHAMLPLCKIAWLRDHQADIFSKAHKFISIKEYCLSQWFGRYIVDYAIAGASGLWDKNTFDWNENALNWAGIHKGQLSEPVAPTNMLDRLVFKSFDHPTITPDTKFVMGASDGCLANLNASGFQSGEATLTLGTSGAIRLITKTTIPDSEMRIFDYFLTQQHHVIGGPTNNGGIVLDWLQQKLYPDIKDASVILQKAESISPASEGLVCLPYFFGERAPLWKENVSGQFFGVKSTHGRDHFARAALEGIVFNIFGIAEALQSASDSQIRAIWTDGGLTRSDFITQLIADVFNLPVYHSASTHGVARGAVLLAAYALKLITLAQISNQKNKEIHPNQLVHQQLSKAYQEFARLRDAWK